MAAAAAAARDSPSRHLGRFRASDCVRAGKYRKEGGYKFPRGTAKVLSKEFRPLSSLVSIQTTQVPSAMQVG